MPREVLGALRRRPQQIGPPQRQHPRPVLRRVRILARELQGPRPQFGHRPRHRVAERLAQLERIAVERRIRRHPPRTGRQSQAVRPRHPREPALAQRRGQHIGVETVVTPLAGVEEPVRRADHLPRGPHPAGSGGRRRPAGHRTASVFRLPVQLQQHTPDVRVADPGGGVGVPGERGTARTAARHVLGPGRTRPPPTRPSASRCAGRTPGCPAGRSARHSAARRPAPWVVSACRSRALPRLTP